MARLLPNSRGPAATLILSLLVTATGSAQLPSASPAALGMGDNYTAVARGFGAVAWNPANLGLSGNPRFSMALLGMRGSSDLGPVTGSDVARYQGLQLPNDVRDAWMQRIQNEVACPYPNSDLYSMFSRVYRCGFERFSRQIT